MFSEAVRSAGNVLLATSLRTETLNLRDGSGRTYGSMTIQKPVPSIAALQKEAAGHAPLVLPKATGVDEYWTFVSSAGNVPTLPVLAFQLYIGDAFEHFSALTKKTAT